MNDSLATNSAGDHSQTPDYGDTGAIIRIGVWSLLIALGGFIAWAVLAPLDEGIPAQGIVAIDTKRKAVQHQQGGIIREMRVKEGDHVEEGQVIVILDSAAVRANYESIRQHYFNLRAMEGRLLAEQTNTKQITFHPDLIAGQKDLVVQQQLEVQNQLFKSRRESLAATLAGVDASIASQQAQIQGSSEMIKQRERQLSLLKKELEGITQLAAEGYTPRNRQSELERTYAELSANLAELRTNRQRAQRAVEELHQRGRQQNQEYRKEVDTQLAEVRRDVQADAEKLTAITDELQRTELRAPATGQVVGLAIQTVGGVIQGAQKLMDIVPEQAPLVLEARISPHLSDKVHAGLLADVRFSAFAHSPQLLVEGKIISVSNDLLTEQETHQNYYLARIEITPSGIKSLGGHQIQPGMPAEVIIKTGERSLLTYLLHPLVRRIAQSMKEE